MVPVVPMTMEKNRMNSKSKDLKSQLDSSHDGDVGAALELLREALHDEEQRIRSEGAQAMAKGDFGTATAVIDFAKQLLAFTEKVESLGKEWNALEKTEDTATPAVQKIVSKRFFGKSRKGDTTPHTAFCIPILETLIEMGGGGKTGKVLDRVGEKMKDTLKPKDFERLTSQGKPIRWRINAQWARNTMANEDGRMKNDSRNGYWEISDKGRAWMAVHEKSRGRPSTPAK